MQAVTRVNAEQASKRVTWEPTRLSYGEGRSWLEDERQIPGQSHRGMGDGMYDREIDRNTGSPRGEGVKTQPVPREGKAGPRRVTDRPVRAKKPGNAGGAKGP
jgi:hypothetical protein